MDGVTRSRPGGTPAPRSWLFGFAASAAQSRGEYPGSRITLRDADDFLSMSGVGAKVLLLRPVPPPLGARRAEAAAERGVRREAVIRGGCRPVGVVWFDRVGGRRRGTGAGGGGIDEEVFAVSAVGFDGGGRVEGCTDPDPELQSLRSADAGCCAWPFMLCCVDSAAAILAVSSPESSSR